MTSSTVGRIKAAAPSPLGTLTSASARNSGGQRRFAPLDGLRGIAVLAVFCFHAGVARVPGGLLGVDLFFVISGYLITGLLVAERQRNGRLSFANFWGRRARRLLPAMMLMVAVVVVVWRFTAGASVLLGLQHDAVSTLLYFANWHFSFAGQGYFDHLTAPSPLLHMWSLAVEEQFYLVWPLVVWAAMRGRTVAAGRRVLRVICLAGTAASTLTLVSLSLSGANTSRIYYGTDSRSLALMVGALLALYLPLESARPARRLHRAGFALLGAAGAAGLVWFFLNVAGEDPMLYHGGFLLVSIASAAIIAGLVGAPRGPLSLMMVFPPLRQLGRISYGVYLWHWPVILFLTHQRTGAGGLNLLALRAAVTLTLASASWMLLEQPFQRLARFPRRSGHPLRFRVAGTAATSLCGTAIVVALVLAPLPAGRTANATVAYGHLDNPQSMSASMQQHLQPPPAAAPAQAPQPGAAANPAGAAAAAPPPVRGLVMGDSLAYTLAMGGFDAVAPQYGANVQSAAIIGCGVAPNSPLRITGQVAYSIGACYQWEQKWTQGIDWVRPDVAIILLGRWETPDRMWHGSWHHIGEPDYNAYLSGQLDKAITIASSKGAKVALLQMPCLDAQELPDGSTPPEDTPERIGEWNNLLSQAAGRHPGVVRVFSMDPLLCRGGKYTPNDASGQSMRTDDGVHISHAGSRDLAQFLLPQIVSWVRDLPAHRPPPPG